MTVFSVNAQLSNLHTKKIKASGTIILDKQSIVPYSLYMDHTDSSFYSIDFIKATLNWKKPVPIDSILIHYRTFPIAFSSTYRRFNYDSISNNFMIKQNALFNRNNGNESYSLFNFGSGITYNGSFGRSLTVGNNQDAVLNSQLNLQLSGYIGDSIQLSAAITDNNIPIQPDGTTQQLNEFDKILIQFKKNGRELNLGDIDVRQNKNYFLNFYKRLQGVSYSQQSKLGTEGNNKLLLSGAIAKGKFNRNSFNGLEGNQGPYKLQGANNELYFVVLANTEHVFIDGELLQRGDDQDYIINYNSAEVTFTSKRMITKDKRIEVEFEYADRNYLNSLFYVNDEIQVNKRLSFSVSIYSNSDAKNSTINQNLDSSQKGFLSNIGDSIQNAFYPNPAIDTFSVAQIMYAKRKLPNSTDSFYQYSTNKDSAFYLLNFVEVGANKGNYIPFYNGANGKVYQYIPPINKIPQGDYEAAIYLVTPKKQQLFNFSSTYSIDSKTSLQTDLAVSNYDRNLFSTKDKGNDVGMAGRFLLKHNDNLKLFKQTLQYNSTLAYEQVNQNFTPIERIRTVEFTRDWGLPINTNKVTEKLPSLEFEVHDTNKNVFKYNVSGYFRSDNYQGIKQTVNDIQHIWGWNIKSDISLTNNESDGGKGYYFKPSFDINKTLTHLNNLVIGGTYSYEHNQMYVIPPLTGTDSLSPNSFDFNVLSAYIKSNQQRPNKWAFNYTTRNDKQVVQSSFVPIDKSNTYNFLYELLQNQKQQLHLNFTYRQLQVINQNISNITPDKSILGRIDYNLKAWNGFINGNALYETGSGQEQQRDISYIQVATGLGQYTWIDYNKDGIQQLNEFELATFQDQANFVRVYTPTNVYVKSDYTQFNYSIQLNPKVINKRIANKWIREFVGRFNVQSALQSSKKVLADANLLFNPFDNKIADTALIAYTYLFSNTLSFNRGSANWGFDIGRVLNYHKSLLTYGQQSSQMNEWNLKARANIYRKYTFELIQKLISNNLLTPAYSNQNYTITQISTEPRLTFTNGTLFRLQAGYQFSQKKNEAIYGGEKSLSNALSLEAKFNSVQSTSIAGKFTYNDISFNGLPNTATSYIMLDGLSGGKNYLWTIDFTKRLINNLELTVSYEGRKPGDAKVINTGRASLRALL